MQFRKTHSQNRYNLGCFVIIILVFPVCLKTLLSPAKVFSRHGQRVFKTSLSYINLGYTYLLSPLRALNIQGLHRGPPFLPICCTMPQVHSWSFVYFPTDLRHVFFSLLRLPLVSLLFPFSGHGRSFSIVFLLSGRIWQLFEFSCTVLCCWSCFFQKIVIILRINLVWKVSTFWMMVVVTFHDSEPYRRTPNKVCIEYPDFGLGPDAP